MNNQSANWHALSIDETTAQISGNLANGLSTQAASERLAQSGPNTLIVEKKESFWEEFFEELREPMVLMLLVTGVLYAAWGELADAITIFVIILTLNTVEVINEQRSKKAILSLLKLAEPNATVKRDSHFLEIPVEQIVPGDLVLLQAGRRVPADARLAQAFGLLVDESALTGEALPVEKDPNAALAPQTPLAERKNMVYSSTLVSQGKGTALVVSTGAQTEIGRIAGLARQVKEPRTPLQGLMSELSKALVWFALGFSLLVPLVGIFVAHQPPQQMLLTGLSLAFATIPEEMPIIITMVLSLGAFRLSKKHAIVKRLKAVETLGAVTVIATDKTGTLTENRMEVTFIEPSEQSQALLSIGVICNDAVQNSADFTGDPIDTALLRAAQRAGIDVKTERAAHPIVREYAFDNTRKRMSLVYRRDGQLWAAVKGAPEPVLGQCSHILTQGKIVELGASTRQALLERVASLAADGLRVLACAERSLPDEPLQLEQVENQLTFIGLIGLTDPPRAEAREAIATCQHAGVRVMMITGDHPLTAKAIARQIGLDGDSPALTGPDLDQLSDQALKTAVHNTAIFARVTPEHKLRIVQALQAEGERVAVTGDGVNDAPALAAADIGVAMGETGSDVAREAGDMVLADDNFTTIVHAVEEGRLTYENLRKGVRYYLACKLALVLITLIPTLLLIPVPFAPVQIILMELFMDLMAAAAFVAEAAEADLLDQRPRDPRAKFMDRGMIASIVTAALGLFAAVTLIYLVTWYTTHDLRSAQTVAFFGWLVGHVLLAFNLRSERQPIAQLGLGSNRFMLIWAAVVAAFIAVVSLLPGAARLVKVTPLTGAQWAMLVIACSAGTGWLEVKKRIAFKPSPRASASIQSSSTKKKVS